ncbi:DMT family transporter [Streptomyces sp. NPDC005576]|uniref:DMT family transporter n=1 Tax=unclassified Streptomyces TaxID=2593676 RepID=UPI00340CA023
MPLSSTPREPMHETGPVPPPRPPGEPAAASGAARSAALPLAGALAGGVALALESVVNGRLGEHAGSVAAATWSNMLSLCVVAIAALFPTALRPAFAALLAALRSGTLRPWHCLGGLAGGSMVLTQALTAATLGPASYTLALVSGQTLCGVLVDHLGLGPGRAHRATRRRLAGGLLSVCAVALPVLATPDAGRTLAVAVLPFLAGCALSWQMAVNGRVDEAARQHPYPAVLLSFAAGSALMVTVVAALAAFGRLAPPAAGPPWHYTGGLLGCAVVLSAVLTVRRIGVLAAGLAMVGGQVLGSLVLGPLTGQPVRELWPVALGAVLLIGAAVLAAPAAGRPSSPLAPLPDRSPRRLDNGGN